MNTASMNHAVSKVRGFELTHRPNSAPIVGRPLALGNATTFQAYQFCVYESQQGTECSYSY